MSVVPPPFSEPPLGPDAVYLMRVSMLRSDGRLVGPFAILGKDHFDGLRPRPPEVTISHFGSVVDSTGNGIYGILGNSRYDYFRAIKELGEEVVASRYRFQVMSAWKQEIEVDWELPLSSRRTRRAFVLFTADEPWARIVMQRLLERGPHATFENVGKALRTNFRSRGAERTNPAQMFEALATMTGMRK